MEERERSESAPAMPVAVIGIGCMFPKAPDLATYWANIGGAVDAITDIPPTHWRPEDYFDADRKAPDRTYARRGGFLAPIEFSPIEFGISPTDLEAIDTAQLLGLVAARRALDDAGYGPDRPFDRDRVGVILGVTGTLELVIPLGARLGHPLWRRALADEGVDPRTAEKVVERIAEGYVEWQENSFPGLLGNVVAGRIANRLDLRGTNCVVDAACASSLSALHLASLELASGRAEMVVTGGIDTFNDIFMYMCFSKTPALSPTGEARPFSADADGTILGEGLGILVLKRLEAARRDGDRIYAVLRGIGSSSDGKGTAVYAPKADGQIKALRAAYANAGVTPDTIELVEAHGTGTAVGDATEVAALIEVYRAARPEGTWCALGSVKSQIGHTKAAAGAAGLIKAICALYHKVLPPTIKVARPVDLAAPGRSPFYVNTAPRPWLARKGHPRRAAVSSFGFGGSNFHCILEEADGARQDAAWDPGIELLALSGATADEVRRQLAEAPREADWSTRAAWCAASRRRFEVAHAYRLVAVVERDKTDWSRLLASAAAALEQNGPQSGTGSSFFFGRGAAAGKLAFLFPGQGAQYVGMLRDWACAFPELLEVLDAADALWAENAQAREAVRLSERIYPQPAFEPSLAAAQEAALRATDVAQPALAAVSCGAFRVLESFGISPDCAAGHSFGELVALCAAQRFASADLMRLAQIRGRLMANGNGAAGAMLAVHAPLEVVNDLIQSEQLDLVIANKNAPQQAVLSGTIDEIERAAESFAQRQLRSTRLAVSAAFHSPLVAQAATPFAEALRELTVAPGSIPVYSNTTAAPYPGAPHEVRSLLAGHLAHPVEFVEQIRAMHREGVRTYLEVGPSNQLTGLVSAILAAEPHVALAVDAGRGRRSGLAELARVLAQLAAHGHSVNLARWNEGLVHRTAARRGLTVPICGANYVRPKPPTEADHSPAPNNGTDRTAEATARSHASRAGASAASARVSGAPMPPRSCQTESSSPTMSSMHDTSRNLTPPALPAPSPANENGTPMSQAFWVTQQNIAALQKLQEQTAQAHLRFLESQESALRALESLLAAQQQLAATGFGTGIPVPAPVATPPATAVSPAPRSVPPPALEPAAAAISPAPVTNATDNPSTVESPLSNGAFASALLEVVAEKTGYPVDMLELDMELDADLGIDSIKRVEILSALQERFPDAPQVKSDELGTFRTLRQVVEYLATGVALPQQDAAVRSLQPPVSVQAESPAAIATHDISVLQSALLEVVAEKTGYPVDMLELDMELDADLGIDSIKRVEILSALQERFPDAPQVKSDELGTFRTLRAVVDYLSQTGPRAGTGSPSAPRGGANSDRSNGSARGRGAAELGSSARLSGQTIAAGSEQRLPAGAPAAIVFGPDPDVDRYVVATAELDTSDLPEIPLPTGSSVWVTDDGSSLAGNLVEQLERRGLAAQRIGLDGIPSSEPPADLAGLFLLAPLQGADAGFLRSAFALVQQAGPRLRAAGSAGGALLITVSRMDGTFHLSGSDSKADWFSGGLAGLAKTVGHEWPEVHAKAIDLAIGYRDLPQAAAEIVEEAFHAGPVEVGIRPGSKCTLVLEPVPPAVTAGAPVIGPDDVVVMTGGARGVTAAAALALARACRPTLLLLGRSPAPAEEPDWLQGLTSEAEIKRALAARGANGPQALRSAYQAIVAQREIRRNLERLAAAGAKVVYQSVDVRDPAALRATFERARRQLGPIRGLIHGAGVLADRFIEDKTLEQFDLVFDTKARGLVALLDALAEDELKLLFAFSSSTGRFGRTGQIDYAMANEVVNKRMQHESLLRPDCRVVSANWGPWSGGMVTAALARVFENEGIALVPLEAGGELVVRELFGAVPPPVEIVVLGKGSALRTPAVSVPSTLTASEFLAVAFERSLDVESHPFLQSHLLDGRPVLPLAVIIEWLAHGALHANPGLAFCGFDELRVFKGVVLDPQAPPTIQVLTGRTIRQGDAYYVPTELRGRRRDGRMLLHARARLVLADQLPAAAVSLEDRDTGALAEIEARPLAEGTDIYRDRLFHGPAFHAIRRVRGWSEAGITVESATAPAPGDWIKTPLRGAWLADPLAVDAVFQAVILWAQEEYEAPALPCFVGGYRQYERAFPRAGVTIVVKVVRHSPRQALVDAEFRAGDRLIATMTACESTIDSALWQAFGRNPPACVQPKS